MPELPEVETLRRDLEKEVVGRRIKAVQVNGTRSVRRVTKRQFLDRVTGHRITAISRKGKFLLFRLDGGDILVVHLGMSGQLLRAKSPKEPRERHTHAVFTFSQGGELRFVDPRTFGELFVTTPDELAHEVPELAHLGFDPLDDVMSWVDFGERLRKKTTRLKTLLMDQKFIAGIGNIYSDEILFGAGLRWDRTSDSLTSQEVRRLYRSMVETLQDAVKHRGSSLADEQYRDLFGEIGEFQSQHKVYDREGESCRRCRSTIVRVKVNGRSSFLCEQCQV